METSYKMRNKDFNHGKKQAEKSPYLNTDNYGDKLEIQERYDHFNKCFNVVKYSPTHHNNIDIEHLFKKNIIRPYGKKKQTLLHEQGLELHHAKIFVVKGTHEHSQNVKIIVANMYINRYEMTDDKLKELASLNNCIALKYGRDKSFYLMNGMGVDLVILCSKEFYNENKGRFVNFGDDLLKMID
jgi:nitroreductase